VRRFLLRLRAVFGRRAIENDMQAEMREHLERAAERLIARGMTPEDARLEARREFGNVTVIQENARDVRGGRWIAELAGDLRFAVRYFGRNKLTVAIIIGVFALGIGANTALVTAIQSQFQRPAPAVPNDDALVWILGQQRATPAARWGWREFSFAELRELAARTETFTDVAAWHEHDVVLNPGDSIGPRGVRTQFVTPNYFNVIGVRLVAGAGLTQHASQEPAKRVGTPDDAPSFEAVMAFGLAERLYGTPTTAIGQRVLVNDVPVHIVGLAPPAFQGAVRHMGEPGLWIPLSARADIARVSPRWLTENASLELFGRVAPGVSHEQAAAIMQLVVTRSLPDSAARVGMARTAQVRSLHSMKPDNYETILIFGALGFIGLLLLLVTCTNVSSLMVAAAVARRHEIAVRLSLGASRARILRQLLTETTLLAVAGGASGLLVCWWLLRLGTGGRGSIDGDNVMPDVYTLAYTMAIAIVTGIVFGLSPALHATRAGVGNALRDSGASVSRKSRLQRGFVVAQIVLSQPLLVILGVTLSMLIADYQPTRPELSERVTRVTFRPLGRTGAPGHRREAVDSLIPRIAAHPEVTGVAPDAIWSATRGFIASTPDGVPRIDSMPTTIVVEGAAPGWFALLDIPLLLGRDVSLSDTSEHIWPVVIGSDHARIFWGSANPIGQSLSSPRADGDSIRMTVVGVYDAAHATTRDRQTPRVFTARGKEWRRDALLVRTRGAAEPFMPELRRLIRDQAPGLPVTGVRTLANVDEADRRDTLVVSALVGAGGALALLLASLGLYGVIALAVRQRTREIGIRIALGAKPLRVARMFLASGVRLGAVALLIGLPLSMVMLKLMLSQAEFLAPRVNAWLVGAGVAVALLAVSAASTWIPARRASLVDPANTLRTE
jgi:predicted permease